MLRTVSTPSTGHRFEVRRGDRARVARRRGCCAARRSRTCPGCVDAPATTTPRGSNSARKPSSSRRLADWSRVRGRESTAAAATARRARPARRPRRAAVDDDERVHVDRRDVGRVLGERARAGEHRARARRGRPAGSPRNGAEQLLRARGRRCRSCGVDVVERARRGTRRRRAPRRARRRRPSITHGPNCGSRTRPAMSSRVPRTIGATSSSTAPSSGRAAASSSLRGRARPPRRRARPRRTRPRSVLCAIASPHSFTTTGKPIACGRGDRAVGVGGGPFVEHGHAVRAQQLPWKRLRRGSARQEGTEGPLEHRRPDAAQTLSILPVLVAEHALEQLAGVGARAARRAPRSRAGACTRARRGSTNARSSSRSIVSPGFGLHDRVHALAPLVVGDAEHRGVEHLRVRVEHGFDLGGIDVHAARDDHVLLAVADVDEAFVVDVRDVADRLPLADRRAR